MDQQEKRILTLLEKVHQQIATDEELEELDRWYRDFDGEGTYTDQVDRRELFLTKKRLKQRLFMSINHSPVYSFPKPLIVAASVLLLLGAAWTFVFYRSQMSEVNQDQDLLQVLKEASTVGNRAILTMPDGSRISLDSKQKEIRIADNGLLYGDGHQVLTDRFDGRMAEEDMTISTPKGGRYIIILPDSTKVWLNASSSLRYPAHFRGGKREVSLAGEGFFEVSNQEKSPFIVHSAGQQVRVLGTSFNIQAYPDERQIKTTLVSGKVQVKAGNACHILTPSEASVLQGGALSKEIVDIRHEIAWKEGRFSFENKNLQQVMREMSRWYNLQVAYEGTIPDLVFFGGTHADGDIETVLNMLQANGLVYRLEGDRTLIIGKAQPADN